MRTVHEAIASLCQIPLEVRRRSDVSVFQMVKAEGCLAHQIGVGDIQQYLQVHSELIQEWFLYSENKRTGSGWYFDYPNRQVGFFSDNRREQEQTFDDITQACSVFIRRELDAITNPRAEESK